MQFTIPKAAFVAALRLAAGVADRKSTMPILGNVLLRVSKQTLLVAATDLNVSLSAEVELDNQTRSDGALTLSAATLREIVEKAPGDTISVKRTDGDHAEIVSGKSKVKLFGMADRDFPKMPGHREVDYTTFDSGRLIQLLERTLFSVCNDETRFHLNGIYLHVKDGKLISASTDGHRLSEARIPSPSSSTFATDGIIVPRKGAEAVRRLLLDSESCSVAVRAPYLFVRQDSVAVAVKLIDAKFPLYDQIIPKDTTSAIAVNRVALLESLRRVQLTTPMQPRIEFATSNFSLHVESTNADLGETKDEIDTVSIDGTPPRMGVNPKFMGDLLAAMSADTVVIRLTGSLDPMLIEQLNDDGFRGVVMPMRV